MPEAKHMLCFEGMHCCTGISVTSQYKGPFSSVLTFFNLFIFVILSLFVKADLAASCQLIYAVRDRGKRLLCLHSILKEESKTLFSSGIEHQETVISDSKMKVE